MKERKKKKQTHKQIQTYTISIYNPDKVAKTTQKRNQHRAMEIRLVQCPLFITFCNDYGECDFDVNIIACDTSNVKENVIFVRA